MARKEIRKDTPNYVIEIAQKLRNEATEAEIYLWDQLHAKRFGGYKFRRQHYLGRYVADFYCASAKLVIEVDGGIHERPENKEYDKERENFLKARGLKIIRFANDQIVNEIDNVLDSIYQELNTGK